MMRTIVVALACAAALAAGVQGVSTSDQSFVVIGEPNASLVAPVLLEVGADQTHDVELEILNPFVARENEMIHQNQLTLASMELLAHQLHAPVYSEEVAEKAVHDVEHIEHSLIAHAEHHTGTAGEVELLHEEEHLPHLTMSLLEQAPVANAPPAMSAQDAEIAAMEREVAMVELGAEVQLPTTPSRRAPLNKKNDYAFLDDPKNGGAPTVLKNLKGLDIYVVNTPIADNDNEIRPVKPPHPMSAAMRQKAKLAALMRKQLIHDVPQPKAAIKPKTRINTLSAYESSLVPSKPLSKLSRLDSRNFDDPIVGGQGAIQLKNAARKPTPAQARFMQLPGTPSLPVFPKDPKAAPIQARLFGTGSSFDNRDGPPALLDDMLPLKAVLVEELDPLHLGESKPTGW